MKKIFFFILMINQALLAQNTKKSAESFTISNPNNKAISPRLTTDHKGNPVISWAEQDDSSDVIAVCFAVSKDGGKTFSEKKNVRIVKGITAHAEGMPKLAFKSDGTIVAIYETKRPVPDSRFSGDLLYTMSNDGGDNWAIPQYVHTDTSAGKSRSFSDIIRLPNGEIGVSWLGERGGKAGGRPVKFAQTSKSQGFGKETTAKEGACECCRTNLFADTEGGLHIFFRDILADGSRDMGHVVSKDNGASFGNYQVVYADKWKINGCPHTGPSTAQLGKTLYTAWYTGEDKNIGVKVTDNAGKILTHIKSANARHPQLTATKDKLILVWEEPSEKKDNTNSRIRMQFLKQSGVIQTKDVTNNSENALFPVTLVSGKNIITAYEVETKEAKTQIRYQCISSMIF